MSFYIDPWLYNCTANPADSPAEQREQRTVIEATQRAIDYARRHGVTLDRGRGQRRTPTSASRRRRHSARTTRRRPGRRRTPRDDRQLVHLDADRGRRRDRRHLGRPEQAQGVLLRLRQRAGRRVRARRRLVRHRRTALGRRRRTAILAAVPEVARRAAGRATSPTATPTTPVRGRATAAAATCAYYQYLQGTSMASPHAVGVAALIVAQYGPRDRRTAG